MKKFLSVVMLCVLSLPAAVEALAWSEGASEPFGVLVAAAKTKKKAPAKKQSGPVTKLSDKQYNEFVKIFKSGSLEQFKAKMSKENISPNAIYSHRGWGDNSLLTIASEHSSTVEIVKFLISLGADVNPKTGSGHTNLPLVRATFNKKNVETIFQILLKAGANVNAREDGWTALMLAADKNSPEAVKILLDAGADVNVNVDSNGTALMYAAQNNTPEVVEILLKAGANINAQDYMGETALMRAAGQNTAKVVEMLLNAGANAKIEGISEYDDETVLAIDYARANPKLKGTKALKMLEAASR